MKKTILFTLVLLITFSISAAAYDDAVVLFNKGQYLDSLNTLATALGNVTNANPTEEYRLRILAAHDHWKMGNYGKAMIHFRRCAELAPGKDLYIDMMLISLQYNQNSDAAVYARKILEYDGTNKHAAYGLGEVSYRANDYAAAKKFFEQCVSEDPELYVGWNGLGKTFFRLKKYSEANTAFSTALALNSNSAELMSNLALSYFYMDKKTDAVEYIDRALSLEPDSKSIRNNHKLIHEENLSE
mgnify:CR=1 FL=1